jgi:CRP-like cAMP-binding protein
VGSTDFVLQTPRSFRAVAVVPCQVAAVTREAFQRMSRDNPKALTGLQVRGALVLRVFKWKRAGERGVCLCWKAGQA